MTDNRSDKVKRICNEHVNNGCHSVCPLDLECRPKHKDTKKLFDERLNAAAEKLDNKNISNIDELNDRLISACSGFKAGSKELYDATRKVLDDAFDDGLLSVPPEWCSDFDVKVHIASEVHKINIEVDFHQED